MNKTWVNKAISSPETVKNLSASINISEELAAILVRRGVSDFEKAKFFFRPSLQKLHDPFLMKDMEVAVDRLIKALLKQERVLIYGDYDVDGTTSVTLVYGFLRKHFTNISYYIPDRYLEGYGISERSIEFAKQQGYTLIVSLDCGIKASRLIDKAKSYGIDFIVCDHHNPDELPNAVAVLDPKRKDCNYPYKELSGCGVGFKLLQAFCARGYENPELLYDYLDLLAVSIASDIVPITGENRILAWWGIKQLSENPRPGLKALIDISGHKKACDVNSIVFGIGPRINAAGRIDHALNAVNLLLTDRIEEAETAAAFINKHNTVRKELDLAITEEALNIIEKNFSGTQSTVLYNPAWHKGIIGIVASRCIEKYHRPTIILTATEEYATGSARSIPGFDLYEAISRCSDLLEQFGGHTHAAGLKLKVTNLEAFRNRFEEVTRAALGPINPLPVIEVDAQLNFDRISRKFYNIIKQMAPFGPGNMQPVFVTENVYAKGVRLLKEKHIKLTLVQDSSEMKAIAFNFGEIFERIAAGERFNVCYSITENIFNGNSSIQLTVKDIKFISDLKRAQ